MPQPTSDPSSISRRYREVLQASTHTNCYRLVHGGSDQMQGCFVDRLGDFLLYQSPSPPHKTRLDWLSKTAQTLQCKGVYFKKWDRRLRDRSPEDSSPVTVFGNPAFDDFSVRENGLNFVLSFKEGYSCGLFMDQRENRKRILEQKIAEHWPIPTGPLRLLNVFAYTCSFSVAAASVGMETTSLDLSKKYLEWGRRNFEANQLPLDRHDFIYGDAFTWMKRLAKKGRQFDFIILDPPTFSTSKESGVFQIQKRLPELIGLALALLPEKGLLLVSSNKSDWSRDNFVNGLIHTCHALGWQAERRLYVGQPPDFPASPTEKPYLNTCWLQVSSES